MRYQAPRGTNDVLPTDSHRWIDIEGAFREIAGLYGYREIRTPMFEDTDLFIRTSGETSDIVTKEMYDFTDKGGRSVTLKPEGTAPAMRAVVEHSLCPPGTVLRLSYIIPFFRYDRPQKGRYRQAHQAGLELLGSSSPEADAEIIEVTVRFYEKIGIEGAKARINSIGREVCRTAYRERLLAFAEPHLKSESQETQDKIRKNPLRLLDSKSPDIQEMLKGAPSILEFLEPDSKERFEKLQALLREADVPFEVDANIVRGLDYYTETVFEILTDRLGAQSALCGGGRYDKLVQEIGGSPTPSVGVGIGIERALLVLAEMGKTDEVPGVDAFIVRATPDAAKAVTALARVIRAAGLSCIYDLDSRSLKSQLGQADRSGAKKAIIIGTDELAKATVQLRDLATSSQEEIALGDVVGVLRGTA
jgi:histidyl-tRNA synthetase